MMVLRSSEVTVKIFENVPLVYQCRAWLIESETVSSPSIGCD